MSAWHEIRLTIEEVSLRRKVYRLHHGDDKLALYQSRLVEEVVYDILFRCDELIEVVHQCYTEANLCFSFPRRKG